MSSHKKSKKNIAMTELLPVEPMSAETINVSSFQGKNSIPADFLKQARLAVAVAAQAYVEASARAYDEYEHTHTKPIRSN